MKSSFALCSIFLLFLATSANADEPTQRVAPPWQAGHAYQVGELVNYQGAAYKALAGATHRRPDPNAEQGWRYLNDCDDKSPKAVQCVADDTQAKAPAGEPGK